MARGMTPPAQAGDKKEQIQVLNANPVPAEVDMSPVGGRLDPAMGEPVVRSMVDPAQVAPVMRSALEHVPPRIMTAPGAQPVMMGARPDEVPEVKRYRVEATKSIVDRTSGARTLLREGKEISTQQYNIRDLQQQGVRLRDITNIDPEAPL